ncbi:MAG: arylsulfatase [Litorilinea sp.]
MSSQPNILLILNDDMGYSDIGCYGGEVQTPNLDRLAAGGLRYTQFYNTARCCPSRASLLTGLHPHQADVGHMVGDDGIDGYLGDLSPESVTIAEALKTGGYRTYMAGKWHVTRHYRTGPDHNWPCQRGFDDFYGMLIGAGSFYQPRTLRRNNTPVEPEGDDYFFTDVISDEAIRQIEEHHTHHADRPFFQYVAYTAPHWPLHAHAEDIARYAGRFDAGWDRLRADRLRRMIDMGIVQPDWPLSERDPRVPAWEDEEHKPWQARRMEVYAAQIDRMDQGIGRILDALHATGQLENTLIIFLADNGGCAEELTASTRDWAVEQEPVGTATTRDGRPVIYGNRPDVMPGGEETYQSCGVPWANVSNTPFRLYKHWVHEGGIATPFIVHWPAGITARGELRHQPGQLPDVMATFLDVAGVDYPTEYAGRAVKPLEGYSLAATFAGQAPTREVLYWEHEGNKAVRRGKWKLVCKYPDAWELYDVEADRTELHNRAAAEPEIVAELQALWEAWAARCGIVAWDDLLELRRQRNVGSARAAMDPPPVLN